MGFQKIAIKLGLLFGLVALSACSDIKLGTISQSSITASSIGTFCTKDPENIQRYTKLLFVMDKSGSNALGNGDGIPTDPSNIKRADNFVNYYNRKKSDSNIQWGMISFRDPGAQPLIYDTDPNQAIFTQDDSLINQGVARLRTPDAGGTPYGAALALARSTIVYDINKHPDEDNVYVVIFITDGISTSPLVPGGESAILGAVDSLMAVKPGSISLSTAFYGPSTSVGENLLRDMATHGNGKYINFNNTNDLDFDDLIVAPGLEPWSIKHFFVYNLNSAICENGYFGVDSDGDGVCDVDEIKYGLNPQLRSTPRIGQSKGDGYSDFFHYLQKTKQLGGLTPCPESKRNDDDIDLLNECEEAIMQNLNPSGTIKKVADKNDPDTDNDGVLDGIEALVFRHTRGAPLNDRDVLQDIFGLGNAYKRIFKHLNPLYPNPGAPEYDTEISISHYSDSGQTCYTFKQNTLPLYRTLAVSSSGSAPYERSHGVNQNRILTYFIQTKSTDPNGKGVYMYSFQDLHADKVYNATLGMAAGLVIQDGVFHSYMIPKD